MRKVRVDCGCAGLARKLCQVLVQYDVEEAAMRIPIKASKMRARAQVFNQLWFWTLLGRFHDVLGSFMILEHTKKTYQNYQG